MRGKGRDGNTPCGVFGSFPNAGGPAVSSGTLVLADFRLQEAATPAGYALRPSVVETNAHIIDDNGGFQSLMTPNPGNDAFNKKGRTCEGPAGEGQPRF